MENIRRFVDSDTSNEPDDIFFVQSICEPLDMESIIAIISIMEDSIDFDREQEMSNTPVFIREGYDETLDMQRNLFENLEEVVADLFLLVFNKLAFLLVHLNTFFI